MGAGQSSNNEQASTKTSDVDRSPVSIHDKKNGAGPYTDVINHLYRPTPKQRKNEDEVLEAYSPTKIRRRLDEDEETIPTVFRWPHGGRKVFITGTFNGWKERIPMIRSGTEFIAILNLPCGKHIYKFIVDNEWKIDPKQDTQADEEGRINNVIEVLNSRLQYANGGSGSPAGTPVNVGKIGKMARRSSYSWDEQLFDETKKHPRQVPPQLKYTPLNAKTQVINEEPHMSLPLVPSLKHAYFSEREHVIKVGVSKRYKYKFTTIVLYKPINLESSDPSKQDENSPANGHRKEQLDLEDFDVFGSPSMDISYDATEDGDGLDDLVDDFSGSQIV